MSTCSHVPSYVHTSTCTYVTAYSTPYVMVVSRCGQLIHIVRANSSIQNIMFSVYTYVCNLYGQVLLYLHMHVVFIGRLYCESWYDLTSPDGGENLIYPMIRRRAVDEKVLVRKAAIMVSYETLIVCTYVCELRTLKYVRTSFYHTYIPVSSVYVPPCTPLPYLRISIMHLLVLHYHTYVRTCFHIRTYIYTSSLLMFRL